MDLWLNHNFNHIIQISPEHFPYLINTHLLSFVSQHSITYIYSFSTLIIFFCTISYLMSSLLKLQGQLSRVLSSSLLITRPLLFILIWSFHHFSESILKRARCCILARRECVKGERNRRILNISKIPWIQVASEVQSHQRDARQSKEQFFCCFQFESFKR